MLVRNIMCWWGALCVDVEFHVLVMSILCWFWVSCVGEETMFSDGTKCLWELFCVYEFYPSFVMNNLCCEGSPNVFELNPVFVNCILCWWGTPCVGQSILHKKRSSCVGMKHILLVRSTLCWCWVSYVGEETMFSEEDQVSVCIIQCLWIVYWFCKE